MIILLKTNDIHRFMTYKNNHNYMPPEIEVILVTIESNFCGTEFEGSDNETFSEDEEVFGW